MEEYPVTPSSLILVAVMNDPRDLEIARLLGWYRIPLRSAPKVIAVDYLAFYQTAAFGEQKWRIEVLAPVHGHELTTRSEIFQDDQDHPHAHHEYYKIQLGSLMRLPEPILAVQWRRITFFYTTGEHLLSAKTIQDLIIPSEERNILWKALRERASQHQDYRASGLDGPEMDVNLDPEILAKFLGIKEMEEKYALRNQDELYS